MTSRSYFGKMNSTLGSVVPLAMFENILRNPSKSIPANILRNPSNSIYENIFRNSPNSLSTNISDLFIFAKISHNITMDSWDVPFSFIIIASGVIVLVIELALSEDSNCPKFAESFCFAFCQFLLLNKCCRINSN